MNTFSQCLVWEVERFEEGVRHFYDIFPDYCLFAFSTLPALFYISRALFRRFKHFFLPLALGLCQIFPALYHAVCVIFMIVKD